MARGRNLGLAIIVIVLLGAAIGLNYVQGLNSPSEQQVEAQERAKEAAAQQKAHPNAASNPLQPVKERTVALPSPSASNTIPASDEVSGNLKAATVVTLGYRMDAANAQDTKALVQAIQAVESWAKIHPNDCAKIICLDLPAQELSNPADLNVPVGLAVNGKQVSGCDINPGSSAFDLTLEQTVLTAVK